jgi:DNA-binding transcriptional regulator YhcF (GntR family)
MPRPLITVSLDFASIEERIAKGERITVRHIAADMNVSPQIVRRALIEHYSSRVVFQRGRRDCDRRCVVSAKTEDLCETL